MKLVTRQDLIDSLPYEWKAERFNRGWSAEEQEIYQRLLALPVPRQIADVEQVLASFPNTAHVLLYFVCDSCNDDECGSLVEFLDIRGEPVRLCADCLAQALALVNPFNR